MKDNREYAANIRAAMIRMSKLDENGRLLDEEPIILENVTVREGKNGS